MHIVSGSWVDKAKTKTSIGGDRLRADGGIGQPADLLIHGSCRDIFDGGRGREEPMDR